MKRLTGFALMFLVFVLVACSKNQSESVRTPGIDIDLTKMSATMIYSEVFNMLTEPDFYENKSIRIKGLFQVYSNPEETENYFAVIIPDAAACCQQGLEFIWQGEHSYPADYPEVGQEITVTGLYQTDELDGDGIMYSYLSVSDLKVN